MEKEDDIDQLFKRGLSDPEIPFNELDWEKMAHKLDVQKKKKLIPVWMLTASGIAAALAVFLYWVFLVPQSADHKAIHQTITKNQTKPTTEKEMPVINNQVPLKLQLPELQSPALINGQLTAGGIKEEKPAELYAAVQTPLFIVNKDIFKMSSPRIIIYDQLVPAESENTQLERKANALAQSRDPFEKTNFKKIDPNEIAQSVQKKMEDVLEQQHDLTLSAMAAPDISSAKESKPAKISTNLGMLATIAFSPKVSVTSGAVYSKKFYNYGITTNNDDFAGKSWEVDADCDILDIPLNLNYKIMNKKRLSVSINTGLSSYFMLKEKYQFTTGQQGSEKVSNIEINNQNQHLFGIANVSVSFDHKISQSMSIGVQPFAKLPLTGIGYGDANLKSAGVSFSLNIGLFPAKKPGKYAAMRYSSMR